MDNQVSVVNPVRMANLDLRVHVDNLDLQDHKDLRDQEEKTDRMVNLVNVEKQDHKDHRVQEENPVGNSKEANWIEITYVAYIIKSYNCVSLWCPSQASKGNRGHDHVEV